MIKSIQLFKEGSTIDVGFDKLHAHKIEIDSLFLDDTSATLKIIFNLPIIKFRNHDYKWRPIDCRRLSNWYAPKIIILENNQIVQANQHIGIWEIDHRNPKMLLWHFNLQKAQPIAKYNNNIEKEIELAVSKSYLTNRLTLLFPVKNGIEISRSKIPFSAIACFTDHCDFDTLSNLKLQRQFFKSYNIKITKGFFLNHYSKREDTASYEHNENEIVAWHTDGHELAYHSLSQSIKPLEESVIDFKNFNPPYENISTWIDHGFQPYNLSMYSNFEQLRSDYGLFLKSNSIDVFWNYIDSGTAVKGVINQINPNQFTLGAYYKGIKHFNLKVRLSMLIKNIIFHYFNDDYSLRLYRSLAKYFKSIKRKKSPKKHVDMVLNIFRVLRLLFPIFIFWKTRKHKVYPLAEYSPVFFNEDITGETFLVFQTLEMTDFKLALHPANIDLLIKECGLFIGHTYFSAPFNYHQGKLFKNNGEIDKNVESNFSYLSQKITSKDLWNPTLKELSIYFNKLSLVTFNCNSNGEIQINDENRLAFRQVQI